MLSENHTTIEAISKKYFEYTHQWLPMICPVRFEKGLRQFKDFEPEGGFLMTVLAMHLIVTPCSEHPPCNSVSESKWYRACKYYFGQMVSVGEPSIGLVQAGILIALFEHTQCIKNRALVTLGISARVAYAVGLDNIEARYAVSEQKETTMEEDEALHTWWGLILLDRFGALLCGTIPASID